MKRVLLVGSSIFEQWTDLTEIAADAPVVNRAIGGTITADWVLCLAGVLSAESPDAVLFYCGSNDINAGVAEDEIVANVVRCRQILAAYSPETAFAYFGIIKAPQKLGKWDLIDRLNNAIHSNLPAGDLYVESNDVFVQNGRPVARCYIEDGLHLTDEAYESLAAYARPLISDWLGATRQNPRIRDSHRL
jgi:lysophospholipase L1-like esterase